jgi:hypothetical protein
LYATVILQSSGRQLNIPRTRELTVEISSISLSFSLSKNPGSLGDGSNAVDDLAKDILS